MDTVWEKFWSLCICVPCGVSLGASLTFISALSFAVGLMWVGIGTWLAVVVLINSSLPYEEQIMFEKLLIIDATHQPYFVNERSFVLTPVDNLKFYLLSMSVISMLGGIGRSIASLSLMHYVYKKTLTAVMAWAWVILSMLSISVLGILTVDTFYTLSRNEVAPLHNRDFYFKNDKYNFYSFCHLFKWLILGDFMTTSYFQWVVRWAYRRTTLTIPSN